MSITSASTEVNGGVSRSGRVRKKSAKMMEMEEVDHSVLTSNHSVRGTPSSSKKRSLSSSSVTMHSPTKLKITIGGNEVTDNGNGMSDNDHYQHHLSNGQDSRDEEVEEEPVPLLDDYQCEEIAEEEVTTNNNNSGQLSHQPTSVLTSTAQRESPSHPSLKIKFNVSKGTTSMTPEKTTAVVTPSPSTQQPPTKKARLLQSTQPKQTPEPESEANKLFKQIEAGVFTPNVTAAKKVAPTILSFDSLPSITSPVNSTPASSFSKTGKDGKPVKKSSSSPKKPFVTGYTLWSRENRPKVQQNYPEMDFPTVSKKLGEIWQTLSKQEKYQWKIKADKLKQSPGFIARAEQFGKLSESTPKSSSIAKTIHSGGDGVKGFVKRTKKSPGLDFDDASANFPFIPHGTVRQGDGLAPLDVGSHLKILGETLSSMGRRMQLGQFPLGSGDASTDCKRIANRSDLTALLDGTLCAVSSLLTLTTRHEKLDGCPRETHQKILDNLSYIMPGI